jgi:hypothetical protein
MELLINQNMEVVMAKEFMLEMSCDGGKTWDFFGNTISSEQEAVQKKSEIESNSPAGIDIRIFPIPDSDQEEDSRCMCGMCVDAFRKI